MARDVELDIIANDKTFAGTASAERNLNKVDDGLKKVRKSGDDSEKSLRRMAKATDQSANSLASMISVVRGGPVVAAAIAGIAVAASVASTAITTGLGAGLLALGVWAVKDAPQVQAAFASFKTEIADVGRTAAASFVPALSRIAAAATSAARQLQGPFRAAFDWIAPEMSAFGVQFTQSLTRLGPGIQALGNSFATLLHSAAAGLPGMFDSINGALVSFANTASQHADQIAGLEAAFGGLVRGVSMLSSVAANSQVGFFFDLLGKATKSSGGAAKDASLASIQFAATLRGEATAAAAAAAAQKHLGATVLEIRGDIRGYEAAVDDASAALKKNGKTLDQHTAKGRENQAALDQIASSTLAWRDAAEKAGKSTVEQNAILGHGRDQLIKVARQFGMTESQARAYADQVLGIPKNWSTKVKADTAQADEALRETQRMLAGVHGKTIYVRTVNTTVSDAGGRKKKVYARGGVITEPVRGIGMQTGTEYLMGEAGPEAVVPLAGGSAGQMGPAGGMSTVVNQYYSAPNYLGSHDELRRALTKMGRIGHLAGPLRAAGVQL